MKARHVIGSLVALLVTTTVSFAQTAKIQTVDPKPITVTGRIQAFKPGADRRMPVISWGGDVATIYADQAALFPDKMELYLDNDPASQAQHVVNGDTIFFRGTHDMVVAALPAIQAAGGDLTPIYQLTWSTGGDWCVVSEDVKSAKDIKVVYLQYAGPHGFYGPKIITDSGRQLSSVTFKWMKDLNFQNRKDDSAPITDGVTAFMASKEPGRAVMCITPDALMLLKGEGGVKGAHKLLNTADAPRIIADQIYVRTDWLQANAGKAQGITNALLRASEAVRDMAKGNWNGTDSNKLLAASGKLLLDSATATEDVKGMVADCEFVGHSGNISFYTGLGTTRNIITLTGEITDAFMQLGLITSRPAVKANDWNWNDANIKRGLKYLDAVAAGPAITPKVAAKVEQIIRAETDTDANGNLFPPIEIHFDTNQSVFSADKYAEQFQKALEISQTYAGAIVTIEGYADPAALRQAEGIIRNGQTPQYTPAQLTQSAKTTSLKRVEAVKDAFVAYCQGKGIKVNPDQFQVIGMGYDKAVFPNPQDPTQRAANRRALFRVVLVPAEIDEVQPVGK